MRHDRRERFAQRFNPIGVFYFIFFFNLFFDPTLSRMYQREPIVVLRQSLLFFVISTYGETEKEKQRRVLSRISRRLASKWIHSFVQTAITFRYLSDIVPRSIRLSRASFSYFHQCISKYSRHIFRPDN